MRNGHRILSPVLAWKALSDPMEGPKNIKTVPDTFFFSGTTHHSRPRRLARSYLVRLFHSLPLSGLRRRTLTPFSSPRTGRRLPQSNIRRFNSRLRRLRWLWANGEIAPKKIGESLVGWTNYADGTNSIGIRKAIWKRVRFTRR